MADTAAPDPRPQLTAALDQIHAEIVDIDTADLHRPTPCAEYDVKTLLAHVVAVVRKLAVVGNGGVMAQVADPADDTEDWAGTFGRARADLEQVWQTDSLLPESYTLPWGTMSGCDLLEAYAHEFTVHAWDLCRAADHRTELDPQLADAALDWYRRTIGTEDRSDDGPFAPVRPVADDADVYTRLAAFVGRPV